MEVIYKERNKKEYKKKEQIEKNFIFFHNNHNWLSIYVDYELID